MNSDFPNSKLFLDSVLDQLGRDELKALTIDPLVTVQEFEENLARLSVLASPSYFPFARDDSGIFAFHLYPDNDLMTSPIVYLSTEDYASNFVCKEFRYFPIAIMLWVSRYFSQRRDKLKPIIEKMLKRIPNAPIFPSEIWNEITFETCRWSSKNDYANRLWFLAGVGHPFAGVPKINSLAKPAKAIQVLKNYFEQRETIPEILATKIATQTKEGIVAEISDVLYVLKAEAWRQIESPLNGFWRIRGKGIEDWDSTLKSLFDPTEYLGNSLFSDLIDASDTYSGSDPSGPILLTKIGDNFFEDGKFKISLNQYRNAATLFLLIKGQYPNSLVKKILRTCNKVNPDSLAGEIAEYTLKVRHLGP